MCCAATDVCLCMLRLSYTAAAALSPAAILPPCGMHPGVDGLQSCSHPRSCTPSDSGCMHAPVEGKYTFYMHRDVLYAPLWGIWKNTLCTNSVVHDHQQIPLICLQSSNCLFGVVIFWVYKVVPQPIKPVQYLCDWDVLGSVFCRVTPKTMKQHGLVKRFPVLLITSHTTEGSFVYVHRHIFILIVHFFRLENYKAHNARTKHNKLCHFFVFKCKLIELDKLIELSFNNQLQCEAQRSQWANSFTGKLRHVQHATVFLPRAEGRTKSAVLRCSKGSFGFFFCCGQKRERRTEGNANCLGYLHVLHAH